MKRAGGRNGAVLAEQIYKVLPDEKLAVQFKGKLMKEYDQQGLAFKMEAYRYAHNILGETLQIVLKDFEKPFLEYVKERKAFGQDNFGDVLKKQNRLLGQLGVFFYPHNIITCGFQDC